MSASSKKRKPGQSKKTKQPVEHTGYRYCGRPNDEQKRILSGMLGTCR